MAAVAYSSLGFFGKIFSLTTGFGVLFQGLSSGVLGIVAGVCVLAVMKNNELSELSRALSHKFWHSRVIAPEQKEL